jgi:high-affinity Fe2+/Pb2+ permease
MEIVLFVNWLCVEAQHCRETRDISNIFSTVIGTVLGILIGAFISWLVYNRQEKTANKQEHLLQKYKNLKRNMIEY